MNAQLSGDGGGWDDWLRAVERLEGFRLGDVFAAVRCGRIPQDLTFRQLLRSCRCLYVSLACMCDKHHRKGDLSERWPLRADLMAAGRPAAGSAFEGWSCCGLRTECNYWLNMTLMYMDSSLGWISGYISGTAARCLEVVTRPWNMNVFEYFFNSAAEACLPDNMKTWQLGCKIRSVDAVTGHRQWFCLCLGCTCWPFWESSWEFCLYLSRNEMKHKKPHLRSQPSPPAIGIGVWRTLHMARIYGIPERGDGETFISARNKSTFQTVTVR